MPREMRGEMCLLWRLLHLVLELVLYNNFSELVHLAPNKICMVYNIIW